MGRRKIEGVGFWSFGILGLEGGSGRGWRDGVWSFRVLGFEAGLGRSTLVGLWAEKGFRV